MTPSKPPNVQPSVSFAFWAFSEDPAEAPEEKLKKNDKGIADTSRYMTALQLWHTGTFGYLWYWHIMKVYTYIYIHIYIYTHISWYLYCLVSRWMMNKLSETRWQNVVQIPRSAGVAMCHWRQVAWGRELGGNSFSCQLLLVAGIFPYFWGSSAVTLWTCLWGRYVWALSHESESSLCQECKESTETGQELVCQYACVCAACTCLLLQTYLCTVQYIWWIWCIFVH